MKKKIFLNLILILVFLSLILILLFFISSCIKNNKITTDDVALWMSEKYNDTFTLVSSNNQLWTKDYSEIIYTSEKLKSDIVVWVYSNKNFVDNYMAVKYKDEVENLVQPLAEKIYGECKVVNIPIHYGEDHFNNDLNFNNYISNEQSNISIKIATDKNFNSAKEDIEKLANEFKNNKIIASICIFYYDTNSFKEIEKTNDSSKPFAPLSNKRLSTSMNSNYSLNEINLNN